MTQLRQIYKCKICGNIVEVVHAGAGGLVCCGQPMNLQIENTVEAAVEKHIPVIEKTENGSLVKVGSIEHPMTAEHYIEWIEVEFSDNTKIAKKFLRPSDKPEMEIAGGNVASARAYCNLHGLWKSV